MMKIAGSMASWAKETSAGLKTRIPRETRKAKSGKTHQDGMRQNLNDQFHRPRRIFLRRLYNPATAGRLRAAQIRMSEQFDATAS